jgi:hypothetical protein
METILRAKRWQVYLTLLLPLVAMLVLTQAGLGGEARRRSYNSHFYSLFGVLTVMLIMGWQYAVGLALFRRTGSPARFFKINGLIPVVFCLLLLAGALYAFALFLQREASMPGESAGNPLHPVHLGYIFTIMNWLIVHSLVTLVVNNRLVAQEIEAMPMPEVRAASRAAYLVPMKTVTVAFLAAVVLFIVSTAVADIVKVFFPA